MTNQPLPDTRVWTGNQVSAANAYVREVGTGNINFSGPDESGMETGTFMGAIINLWRGEDYYMEINEDETTDEAMGRIIAAYNEWSANDFPV